MNALKTMSFVLAATVLASVAQAGTLANGSYRGKSTQIDISPANPDIVALILKKDPSSDGYLAVMGEYDRVPGTVAGKRTALTSWIPRMYAYRVEQQNELQYIMKPLFVDERGAIITKDDVQFDTLTLKKAGSMMGAFVTRFDRKTRLPTESIVFDGQVGSTWEAFVPGDYMLTKESSGSDYLKKTVNVKISADGVANYFTDEIVGKFQFTERAAGMFTALPMEENVKGAEKLTGRIGVFIDIVNWKHLNIKRFTTEELLMINPDDASDVGFYYERHAK